MTVEQLIASLMRLPRDMEVVIYNSKDNAHSHIEKVTTQEFITMENDAMKENKYLVLLI